MPIVTGDTFDLPLIFHDADGVVADLHLATEIKCSIISEDHQRLLVGPITASSSYRDSNWTLGRVVIPITGASTSALTDAFCLVEAQVELSGQTTYFPPLRIKIIKGLVS
jgi:hypothetical protein